jgi:hypothetical protein
MRNFTLSTPHSSFVLSRDRCSEFLRYGCPPEALLGRLVWVPFYNLAYVTVQQQIGDADRKHETAGLIIGSLAASLVAYPAFMFKYVIFGCFLSHVDFNQRAFCFVSALVLSKCYCVHSPHTHTHTHTHTLSMPS